MKVLIALLLAISPTIVFAAPPKVNNILNIELGKSVEEVELQFKTNFPNCPIKKTYFTNDNGVETADIKYLSVDMLHELCFQNNNSQVWDSVDAIFLHPSIDSKQSLYDLRVFRMYEDPVSEIKYSFEEVKQSIFAKYGEFSAQELLNSQRKIIKGNVNPTITKAFSARYLWGNNVPNAHHVCVASNCGRYYMNAEMQMQKNPKLSKNTFYVKAIMFHLVDDELSMKHVEWVSKQEEEKKQKGFNF